MTGSRLLLRVILTVALLVAPFTIEAQQAPKVPKIGLVRIGSPPDANVAAFLQGLRGLGYVEGQNIAIEYRWAEGKAERIPALTADLVRLHVDVIVSAGDTGANTARQATSTIPIVAPAMSDPVGAGLVATLARPGGNVTGNSIVNPELSEKRVELLKEAFPGITYMAVVLDARVPMTELLGTEAAARALGLRLQILKARSTADLESTFATARRARVDALNVLPSSFFWTQRARIVDLAAKTRLPAMYEQRDFVAGGGLMAYGPSVQDLFRRAATYVDRILKGAKPADLPVEQPTKFEFIINLKSAKALGLTIPAAVLARADEVIER